MTKNEGRSNPKKIRDVFALLGDSENEEEDPVSETENNPIFPDFGTEKTDSQSHGYSAKFPPELDTYLSPNLLRKLKQSPPPRGALFNALDQLRSIQYQLSSYLPANLVQEKLKRPVPGLVKGQCVKGSLLFADVSGFTALSEQLAGEGLEGAEKLTDIMNGYFKVMLNILSNSGGILIKFAGDATLVYFPYQDDNQQAQWCVRAGLRMLRAMKDFKEIPTPQGKATLRMKIGVGTGDIYLGNIGSVKRMEYAITGSTVMNTMHAEGQAAANQLIVDEKTCNTLPESYPRRTISDTFFEVSLPDLTQLDDFEIKAEKRRARGPMTWQLSVDAAVEQMTTAIHQIEALSPYLPNELVERIVVHAKKRRIDSEYRLTTVAFCNFSGPETLLSLWGEKGVSRVTALLAAYYNSMHDVIEHYGGIISRIDPYSKGTKLLILFGAPVMHEDDPIRAVNAALAMNDQLEALNQRWERKFHRHLPDGFNKPLIKHRIGITQGLTFAGQVGSSTRREYTVMGDDVNLAARLMGSAAWGQILISRRVADAVEGSFYKTHLQPIMVKGKSKPIPIAQVEGKRDDTILLRINANPSLIGRDEETKTALAILKDQAPDQPRILYVQGPAGIGKSHFSDQIIREALNMGYEPIILDSQQYSQQIAGYGLTTLLYQVFKTSREEKSDTRNKKIQAMLDNLALEKDLTEVIFRLMGVDPSASRSVPSASRDKSDQENPHSLELWDQLAQTSRQGFLDNDSIFKNQGHSISEERTLRAVEALISARIKEKKQIIYLENADWLDQSSLALILSLVRSLSTEDIMLVINQREPISTRDLGKAHLLQLPPLNQTDSTQLVSHILLESLSETIHEQTNGIPLFIREISEYIQRQLNFTAQNLSEMLQSSNFMQQLVLSRLEVLPEDQRDIARVASVVGVFFRFGEIRALAESHIDNVTLSNNLRSLVAEGIITLLESGVDARYAFQQSHIQEAIYQSLPYDRRREMHAELGSYLSKDIDNRRSVQKRIASFLGGDEQADPIANLEKVAYHFEMAEETEKSTQIRLTAAIQSRVNGAFDRARENINKGLLQVAYPNSTPETRLKRDLLEAALDLNLLEGNYAESKRIIEQMNQLAIPGQPKPPRIRIKAYLVNIAQKEDPDRLAEDWIQPLPEKMKNLVQMINLWIEYRRSHSLSLDSPSAADLKSEPDLDLTLKALLFEMAGNYEQALPMYEASGNTAKVGMIKILLGDQDLSNGQFGSAERYYREASECFERTNDPSGRCLSLYRLSDASHQSKNQTKSKKQLNEFENLLASCPSDIFREGADILNITRLILKNQSPDSFPHWQWSSFADRITINTFLANGLMIQETNE
jgi:class 3 adenylate cyclase